MEFKVDPDFIVEKAFKHLNESFAGDVSKLSKQQMEQLREAMFTTTRNFLALTHKIQDGKAPMQCLSHLDEGHINLIKCSLEIQTYEMTLADDSREASFSSPDGPVDFPATMSFASREGSDLAGNMQIASVVIESVIFFLNVIGISAPKGSGCREVVESVNEILGRFPSLNPLIARMVAASRRGNIREIVEEMIQMVVMLWEGGAFFTIAQGIFRGMAWYDWVLTVGSITAGIVAMVSTAGIALIAQLVVQVTNAVAFIRKLNNLTMLAGRSTMLNTFL
uniref:Uncharacterized protein n=1 Tax=Pinctada fucata TaxID=50426 RepID=A0A194ALT3_PINFU